MQRFNFAILVVVGVAPQEALGRVEFLLEVAAQRQTPGLEVAEVEIPALRIARAIGRAAKRAIREQPAVGRDVEAGPVVVAGGFGRRVQTGLPARGNAAQAAERDERDRLHAAVAALPAEEILGDVRDRQIGRHEAVDSLRRDEIVDPAGLEQRIGLLADDLLGQRAQIGREDDVRLLLLRVKGRLLRADGLGLRLDVFGVDLVGKVGADGHARLVGQLEIRRAVRLVLRRDERSGMGRGEQGRARHLRAHDGQRQMDAQRLAGRQAVAFDRHLLMHLKARADAALGLHPRDHRVERLAPARGARADLGVERAGSIGRARLEQVGYAVVLEANLAAQIAPVERAVVAQGLELVLAEIAHGGLKLAKRRLLCQRIGGRQRAGDFELEAQTILEAFGRARVRKAQRDDALHARKVAGLKEPLHIRRQGIAQIGQIEQHQASSSFT